MLNVTMLGTGGMMPLKNRWLTSCIINSEGHSILVDCGEGTQIALKNTDCRLKPIDMICITHFHADHISGLPGFLLSMGNEGREEPVTIIGPKGIEQTVRSICVIAPNLPFEIKFAEAVGKNDLRCGSIEIVPFEVKHSTECVGYSFILPRRGKFNVEKAKMNDVPMKIWNSLQKYGEVEFEGKLYTYDMVSDGERHGIKVTYCTDTRPTGNIVKYAEHSDLFICEGLYYEPEKLDRAKKTGHMLYSEAAKLALKSGVKEMWLTHYSPAVTEPEAGIEQAKDIFPNTKCGYDGKTVTIPFPEK